MSGCCNTLTSTSFTGPQGVSISSITTQVVGNDTEITFVLSDGSTLGPITIPGGINGTNGTNGLNADPTFYILDSFIAGNPPVEQFIPTYNNIIDTFSTVPANTLKTDGDYLEIDIVFNSNPSSNDNVWYTLGVHFGNVPVSSMLTTPGLFYLKGTLTRVDNNTIFSDITAIGTPAGSFYTNMIREQANIITVSDLDTTPLDLEISVNNGSPNNVDLIKFQTKIALK